MLFDFNEYIDRLFETNIDYEYQKQILLFDLYDVK